MTDTGITLSPAELGVVCFVVLLAGVLVWRVFEKATREMAANREAFFGEKSPVRELVEKVENLSLALGQYHGELIAARRERGDPTPVTTPPSGPYVIHRNKNRTEGG